MKYRTKTVCLITLLSLLAVSESNISPVGAQTPLARIEVRLRGKTLTTAAPLTVTLNLTAELQAAVSRLDEKETALRLTIKTLRPKGDDWSGFHVFLNAPRKQLSNLQSPYYAGSVAFYGGDEGKPVAFTLDLRQTIYQLKQARRWQNGATMRVILVGIPGKPKRLLSNKGIVIKQVAIAVELLPNTSVK